MTERCEVAILGAGAGGMTAAYRLRGREIVVLEAEERVGGRTLSGGDDRAWYNLGAQIISSRRMIEFCRELGLDLVSIRDADYGFVINGQFRRGSSPAVLLARMNLSAADKLDFGVSSLRLRRKLHSIAELDPEARDSLDRRTLLDVIGMVRPSTHQLWRTCSENSAGLPPDSISGIMGLAYGLGAYVDPDSKQEIYGIRGGSQQVARRVAACLNPHVIRLSCSVEAVENRGACVRIAYTDAHGSPAELIADHCICALPAPVVLRVVVGLPTAKRKVLRRVTPYAPLISVAWPVPDGRPAPWDGVFFAPVSGSEVFGLITNYGYLAKMREPKLGGYLNTLAVGATATRYLQVDDDELLDLHHTELTRVFPDGASLLNREGAVLHRWAQDTGLPAVRPGYLAERAELRAPLGQIEFCGDYTSEPGLPGANSSGHHVARRVLAAIEQSTHAQVKPT